MVDKCTRPLVLMRKAEFPVPFDLICELQKFAQITNITVVLVQRSQQKYHRDWMSVIYS